MSGEQPRGPIELNQPSPKGLTLPLEAPAPSAGSKQSQRPTPSTKTSRVGAGSCLLFLVLVVLSISTLAAGGYFLLPSWPQESWQGQTRARLRMTLVLSTKAMERVVQMYSSKFQDLRRSMPVGIPLQQEHNAYGGESCHRKDHSTGNSPTIGAQTPEPAKVTNASINGTAMAVSHECCRPPKSWMMKGLKAMPDDVPWDQAVELPFN
mmetsp:Transcript_49274/g.76958  ORF Transcript_49274/g.76958 Transcript_49274/m.76958 type:complete len:208 (+) Transcript_49274:1408-2031(+)